MWVVAGSLFDYFCFVWFYTAVTLCIAFLSLSLLTLRASRLGQNAGLHTKGSSSMRRLVESWYVLDLGLLVVLFVNIVFFCVGESFAFVAGLRSTQYTIIKHVSASAREEL